MIYQKETLNLTIILTIHYSIKSYDDIIIIKII